MKNSCVKGREVNCFKIVLYGNCVMVFNAAFNNISVIYRGSQFYWWRKPEFAEKTTDLLQVTDKLIT